MQIAFTIDSMNQPNVLYIVHRFPYPPDKGDRIRAFNIIRYLARRTNLTVVALDDEGVSTGQIEELERIVSHLEVVSVKSPWRIFTLLGQILAGKSISESFFFSKALHDLLRQRSKNSQFDAVMISASSLAVYLEPFVHCEAKTIVDLVDVDSEKWRQYADSSRGLRRLIYAREYRRVRQLEERLLSTADAVTLVSEDEADLLRGHYQDEAQLKKIHAVSNGVDLDYFSPVDVEQSRSICFLGAMDYRPNVDAVIWFAKEVWPHLRNNHSDLVFNIVGRNPSPEVNSLRKVEGIHVTGAVPDVRPWLAQTLAVVAPLRIARGIQNKVLEAMAMGRAVVASPEALTGLSVEREGNVLEAVTPDEWYYQIRNLMQDRERRTSFEQAARRYVEVNHSWDATLAHLDELLSLTPSEKMATF
jgi:sugar transferase (PEP-CTERM/EpsH1 system associated)